MRTVKLLSLFVAVAMMLGSFDADARRRRRKKRKKKVAVASVKQKAEYKKLLGKYKWGTTASQALKMLEVELRRVYKPKLRAEKDALKQDSIRKELREKLEKLKKGHEKFAGKSKWDVSMVEGEFAHKNDESVIVRWGNRDRRFYFFHFGKLWKVYIAFNSELFRGKTFHDFTRVMERRFGKGEAKFKMNAKGDSELSHIEWPAAGNTVLKAVDETAFYANFCLVLYDRAARIRVLEGRRVNSPKKRTSDPLVDAVTQKGSAGGDPNASIVDQITGKGTKRPVVGSSGGTTSPGRSSPGPVVRKKKRKKLNPKDPLGGLDI